MTVRQRRPSFGSSYSSSFNKDDYYDHVPSEEKPTVTATSSSPQDLWHRFRTASRESFRDEPIGQHTSYAGGEKRPLCRGYLHGISFLSVLVFIYIQNNIHPVTIPVLTSIVWVLCMSSILHLLPWKKKRDEFFIERLDKCGIVAICCASIMTPQFIPRSKDDSCQEVWLFSLVTTIVTQLLPALSSGYQIWRGNTSPTVFVGVIWATTVAAIAFLQVSYTMVAITVSTMLLYGLGLYIYANRIGGDQPVWGYHEYMHILVTIAMFTNYLGAVQLSQIGPVCDVVSSR